jgi:5'-nucleotidase
MSVSSKSLLDRILVTNDDGIDAPGLAIAEYVAKSIAKEVWTVAPTDDCSGGSRQLNLHKPLRLQQYGDRRFAVTGSPADCVMIGVGEVMKLQKPDLVISGVNAGLNIGGDCGFSGTVGAAMTANVLGIPGVALSQAWRERGNIPWKTSQDWLPSVVKELIEHSSWPWDFVPNINVPAIQSKEIDGICLAQQGMTPKVSPSIDCRTDLRQQKYYWLYLSKDHGDPSPQEDIAILRKNKISISPLSRNITDQEALSKLAKEFPNR